MRIENFKSRMANRDMMAGTFLKTPAYELVEVLATSELDFICIDMEHSPFDRARTDACLAVWQAKYGGSVGAIGTSNCCDCPD